ncbi:MAG: tetratricopeptide repeat protein [Erysipelotrichaceae bacterium]|nr:tetratricopeptide repeat protein [Erysipelotrichaceae bacterium]
MNTVNKSHLIAGFFRYHREKLNYSLRGLVGSGSVVELSSLSDFEHGKRQLREDQLVYLFKLIGYDYYEVINAYDFEKEYHQIMEWIYLGEIKRAEDLYMKCIQNNVFNSLGCISFCLLGYTIGAIRNNINFNDFLIEKCDSLLSSDQIAIVNISKVNNMIHHGRFSAALEILKNAEQLTYEPKLRAWIMHQYGRVYGLSGNYAEAMVALLEAKQRYGEYLGIIRMIQVNLNLGNVYISTKSYAKAEESYLIAYERALMLKESTGLLTKCFNSLCWLYFDRNQYDKLKEVIDDMPDNLVESENTLFILAWAYYKLGLVDECVKYCKEARNKYLDREYPQVVFTYIENAALGKKTGQDALLKKAITMKDYEHNQMIDDLFTRELIDIYERRKNYEKAFKYAKKLLNR